MNTKSIISLLLGFLFLAKLIAVDADGLNIYLGEEMITFKKPFCKKKKFLKESNKSTANYSQLDKLISDNFTINNFCVTQFQFGVFSWNVKISEPILFFNDSFTSRLSYPYLENDSPPPRLT